MKKNLIAKMLEEAKTDINVRNRLVEEYMHVIDKILISDDEDARAFLNLSLVEIIDKYLETNQKIPLSQYINRNIKICYKNYLNKKYPSYDYCLSSEYEHDDIVLNSEISSILNNLTDFERSYVIKVYNEILGGGSNSLLFSNVREKNSLAYYINSAVKSYDNIMFIYSGISSENINKATKLIKNTLKQIEKGNFSTELLNSSKETITSGIIASMDNPTGIINTYFAHELVGSELFEERIEKFNSITKEDIINVSKKISLHTMLTLQKGENNEDN